MIQARPRKASEIIKNPQFNVFTVVKGNSSSLSPPYERIVFNSFEEFERAAETLMRDRGWHLEGRD